MNPTNESKPNYSKPEDRGFSIWTICAVGAAIAIFWTLLFVLLTYGTWNALYAAWPMIIIDEFTGGFFQNLSKLIGDTLVVSVINGAVGAMVFGIGTLLWRRLHGSRKNLTRK